MISYNIFWVYKVYFSGYNLVRVTINHRFHCDYFAFLISFLEKFIHGFSMLLYDMKLKQTTMGVIIKMVSQNGIGDRYLAVSRVQ